MILVDTVYNGELQCMLGFSKGTAVEEIKKLAKEQHIYVSTDPIELATAIKEYGEKLMKEKEEEKNVVYIEMYGRDMKCSDEKHIIEIGKKDMEWYDNATGFIYKAGQFADTWIDFKLADFAKTWAYDKQILIDRMEDTSDEVVGIKYKEFGKPLDCDPVDFRKRKEELEEEEKYNKFINTHLCSTCKHDTMGTCMADEGEAIYADNKIVSCTGYDSKNPKTQAIKDSGTRREFASGAVRDIQEGKGRCDLMPLKQIGTVMKDTFLYNIGEFMEGGSAACIANAIEDFLLENYISEPIAMIELSKHYEEGAKKYGENNWQKGIPIHCYVDSAVRHYFKVLADFTDEPHNRAVLWNLYCLLWTLDTYPHLDDRIFAKPEDRKDDDGVTPEEFWRSQHNPIPNNLMEDV